jgi:hypothetical protein
MTAAAKHHPTRIASLRDRWKFRLARMAPGPERSVLRSCMEELDEVLAANLEALFEEVMTTPAPPEMTTCDNCGTQYVGPVCHGPGDAKDCFPVRAPSSRSEER